MPSFILISAYSQVCNSLTLQTSALSLRRFLFLYHPSCYLPNRRIHSSFRETALKCRHISHSVSIPLQPQSDVYFPQTSTTCHLSLTPCQATALGEPGQAIHLFTSITLHIPSSVCSENTGAVIAQTHEDWELGKTCVPSSRIKSFKEDQKLKVPTAAYCVPGLGYTDPVLKVKKYQQLQYTAKKT